MEAQEVIEKLQLQPLPIEGGYFREMYANSRCSTIYFLITPGNFSAFHKLVSDEIYHFYMGDPVELETISPDGERKTVHLGNDLSRGEVPLFVVPANHWQGSRVSEGGRYSLVGCTVNPAYKPEDCEHAERSKFVEMFPQHQRIIQELTR
jgi:predicted cupin superfamily sugar epimerase